ncbi:hypothetical protein T440DRAFT_482829 [Plenodomus tracheiphilus IPT5]|uniref:Uncharacterized protein n=1 Tax=Plenodomus tracheiphilus IPT5 TaxID=1408161 RepID=A0A6A7AVF8_9PLEO|nr:hypothetical protein T440DRAFT_482829 [Plenodomus tracheiphilus IPT5]
MSYYGIYHYDVDTMTCASCGAAAFAWMAEVFACPVCGGEDYLFPLSEIDTSAGEGDGERASASMHGVTTVFSTTSSSLGEEEEKEEHGVKRKRTLSSDGEI